MAARSARPFSLDQSQTYVTYVEYILEANMPEISSREFAAEPLKVKRLVRSGPVIVTNRGVPELVVIPYERWRALVPQVSESLVDVLGDDAAAEIDFEPPRIELDPRPIDLDD